MRPFVTIIICLIFYASCRKKEGSFHPNKENITESVYASGIIKSVNQYQVYSTVNGILDDLFVKEGDTIELGQTMFKIFNETSKLNTENAELNAQFSDYANNRSKIEELKINVELAKKRMIQDSMMWMRQLTLWKNEIGSKLELEQKELNYRNSNTIFKSASLRLIDSEKQLKFISKQSKKSLQISKRMQNDYEIRSEVKGKVYRILKNKGELVNTQTALAIVGNTNQFLIELQVDEYDIAKIKCGMQVYLALDSYRDSVYEATISIIYPIMNERSKTFTVEAVFTKRPPVLYPNLTVEANIVLRRKNNVLTIPRKYILNDSFVMHIDGRKLRIQTGLKDYQKVEIISGITSNDELVLPK